MTLFIVLINDKYHQRFGPIFLNKEEAYEAAGRYNDAQVISVEVVKYDN